jgi:WD40 repeat protein
LGSFDNQIYLYSVDNGRTSNINAHDDAVSCLASTSAESNAMLVSGSWDSSVKVWNIETSSPLMAWGEHESEIKCCAIDDNLVLSGDTSGVVCLFDTRSQNKIKSFQLSDSVCAVELCSSATLMAASVDGTMQLFDIRKSKERVASIETQRQLTCARSDGDRVICGDASGVVSVWTFDQMELELESKKGKSVASLCTSTDGAMIVAGFDGDVAVFASS